MVRRGLGPACEHVCLCLCVFLSLCLCVFLSLCLCFFVFILLAFANWTHKGLSFTDVSVIGNQLPGCQSPPWCFG